MRVKRRPVDKSKSIFEKATEPNDTFEVANVQVFEPDLLANDLEESLHSLEEDVSRRSVDDVKADLNFLVQAINGHDTLASVVTYDDILDYISNLKRLSENFEKANSEDVPDLEIKSLTFNDDKMPNNSVANLAVDEFSDSFDSEVEQMEI